LASRRSDTDYSFAPSFLALEAHMADTSHRRSDADAIEASEKRERLVAEESNPAARVRELLGSAIAARL
jgi:hypothetical protein